MHRTGYGAPVLTLVCCGVAAIGLLAITSITHWLVALIGYTIICLIMIFELSGMPSSRNSLHVMVALNAIPEVRAYLIKTANGTVHHKRLTTDLVNGDAPLHLCRSATMARILVIHGADVHQRNKEDCTPLHCACTTCNTKLAMELIQLNSDIDAISSTYGTALHIAVGNRNFELVHGLLKSGASVDVPSPVRGSYGTTPLHLAVSSDQVEVAELLLQFGADPRWELSLDEQKQAGSRSGCPPALHQAESAAMVQLLLRYGASVDQPSHNVLGMTPLHFACSFERSEVVRALLQQGATVPRVADNGYTCLHFASSGEIVSLLLEAGAPLEQRCVQGMTPLYCAATERRLDVFRTLLRAGAMIEGVRSFDVGMTSLQEVIAQNDDLRIIVEQERQHLSRNAHCR